MIKEATIGEGAYDLEIRARQSLYLLEVDPADIVLT
jgi:hypothetical protein